MTTISSSPSQPTPLSDPHGYLSLLKFSRKLARCPRTGLPVSFADIGDPLGVPVLFIPPSGCTRWLAAPQDPLAQSYGIRLIVVDRPGVGAVPLVPLAERIDVSCKITASVLEHLDVKVAHVIATSAGIYCALHLIATYHDVFATALSPPPSLYLVAPWSPPLPPSHPLWYRQLLDWVPNQLLSTQYLTLPYIVPAAKSAEEMYGSTTKAFGAALGALDKWWTTRVNKNSAEVVAATPLPELETARSRLWAPSARYLTMDYLYAEEFRGIGEEHLICLNRGSQDTGPAWFERTLQTVAEAVTTAQARSDSTPPARLKIDVWWGLNDGMVPLNGQVWLNKTLAAHPDAIQLAVHTVPDGDHTDLLQRREGIGEVYTAITTRSG